MGKYKPVRVSGARAVHSIFCKQPMRMRATGCNKIFNTERMFSFMQVKKGINVF